MAVGTSVLVFVVEDQALLQEEIKEALVEGGFDVTLASSGEEAISMIDRKGADYNALITDIDLGGNLTGWDVAKRAREINDRLPVIYTTGASAHDWASKGVPNSQLIRKPFAMTQVLTALAQLINAATSGD